MLNNKIKTKDIHIRIKDLVDKEYRKITAIIDRAVDNYLKLKKIDKK